MEEFKCGASTCGAELVGDGSAIVTIQGELDMHASEEAGQLVSTLQELGVGDRLVVDLTDCTFIDSIGLSVLIGSPARRRSRH